MTDTQQTPSRYVSITLRKSGGASAQDAHQVIADLKDKVAHLEGWELESFSTHTYE